MFSVFEFRLNDLLDLVVETILDDDFVTQSDKLAELHAVGIVDPLE
jgi:hypothetical protein